MNTFFFIPLSLTLGLVIFGLASKWYYWPWAMRVTFKEAVTPILLINATRYIGLGFLVPGVVSPDLNPLFAQAAAYGDLAAACLALIALCLVRLELPGAVAALWIFNIEGFLDFLDALGLGLTSIKPEQLQGVYYIPTLVVPLLMVSEIVLFVLLVKRGRQRVHGIAISASSAA